MMELVLQAIVARVCIIPDLNLAMRAWWWSAIPALNHGLTGTDRKAIFILMASNVASAKKIVVPNLLTHLEEGSLVKTQSEWKR